MKTQTPRNPSEQRAWQALGAVESHAQVKQWLADADSMLDAKGASHDSRTYRWGLAAAAAVAALGLALGGYWHWMPERYQTGLGEQRDVTLPDGSRVTLNTDTSVAVRFTKERRHIELHRGEALFAVKPDAARPFDVEAGGALTRAIGTEFNVDLRGPKVTVSVLEGVVSVVAADVAKSDAGVRLSAQSRGRGDVSAVNALSKGRAIEFRSEDGRIQEQKADLRRIDAWRTRRLEFTDTPLTEAVEEFNRYSAVRVVIGTPDLAAVRVSGVFRIGDSDGFLYSLREALQLETHESLGEVIVLRPAE
jgi:transmembrane sensor